MTTMKSSLIRRFFRCFWCYGIGGTIGAILTGVFATQQVTGATEALGAIDGNADAIVKQLVSVIVTVYAVISLIILKLLEKTMAALMKMRKLRMDLSEHGEEGRSGFNDLKRIIIRGCRQKCLPNNFCFSNTGERT